jgi:hypothetical protein
MIGLYDGVGMPSALHKVCSGSAAAERKPGECDDARMGESLLRISGWSMTNGQRSEHTFLQLFNTDWTYRWSIKILLRIKDISYGYDHSDNAL